MQKSLKTLYPYLTIYALLVFVFYSTGFNRNWPFWADQELSQTYAALLLNSGLGQGQELLSNPGFFSIHLMQLLVNFCNYLNLYQIATIDDLKGISKLSYYVSFSSLNYNENPLNLSISVKESLRGSFAISTTIEDSGQPISCEVSATSYFLLNFLTAAVADLLLLSSLLLIRWQYRFFLFHRAKNDLFFIKS